MARPIGVRPAVVLAVAIPPLFLHGDFQPNVSIGSVALRLSDVAVLAVMAAAVVEGLRSGFAVLAAGRWLWLAAGGLGVWTLAAALYGGFVLDGFPTGSSLVTGLKLAEYMLLAPAVALIVRGRADLAPTTFVLVGWCTVAAAFGALQFVGADIFDAWPAGGRQPSLLGHNDFAALGGAAFTAGLAALVLEGVRKRLAIAAGVVALVIAAPLAGLLGIVLGATALAILATTLRPFPLRRVAAAIALTLAVGAGMVAMRAESVAAFLDFLAEDRPTTEIETYSHRTVLAYIGLRIFADHPIAGVGLRGSSEPDAFEPYLADARRRFPDAAPLAFPSDERRYGVQSLYIQTLADLGLVGFVMLVALAGAALALAYRARRIASGVIGLLWLLLAAGLWTSQGLVAGLPLDALTWIAAGLIVAGAQVASSDP